MIVYLMYSVRRTGIRYPALGNLADVLLDCESEKFGAPPLYGSPIIIVDFWGDPWEDRGTPSRLE
jgi:hypothetical protein